MEKTKKILKWIGKGVAGALAVFGVFLVILIIVRMFHFYNLDKTNAEVAKIHATKLTLDDVMGKNLPPDPGANADTTIAGVDANNNGIRDDVELAIFKAYPNLAKTRAVLLQYALTLQLEMTLPILNTDTATAVIADNNFRAHTCISNISSRSNPEKYFAEIDKNTKFVENLQLNNEQRKNYLDNDVYNYVRSYSASNGGCDLDLSTLPN